MLTDSQENLHLIAQVQPNPSNQSGIVPVLESVASISASFAALIGIFLAWRQLGRVVESLHFQRKALESTAKSLELEQQATEAAARSLEIQRKAVQASVILDCSAQYHSIVGAVDEYINETEQSNEDLWWYRLWDLYTKEFFFYKKGLIDRNIYEVWIIELARVYYKPPFNKNMKTRWDAHQEYLESRLPPDDSEIQKFFRRIHEISQQNLSSPPVEFARQIRQAVGTILLETTTPN
ncbi:MAG: hypothetical protein ACFB12_18910 [Leptolyngbyaceae cyanobacterium]